MNKIELTKTQTAKILWAFVWRGWVLFMPIWIFSMAMMFFLMPSIQPGQQPQPPDLKNIPLFFVIWLVMMVGGLFTQIIALRWALKTKWSDFRIAPVSASSEVES